MPASCASLPAPMKRSTCSSDLSILKDEIEEGFAKKDNKRKGSGKDSKPKSAKKIVGQLLNQNKARDTAEHALKVDERLRLARQRREQQQKELASREQGWLAKEERAKRHYEKHLEERRRKLEEQRMREERRRKAVEEKRRQRLNEERERYEQVVKKTMERSQKAKQKLSQLSRQRAKLNANKALRCRPLTEWEKDLVRRLQTPTIAQLARSRSVGPCESDAASCHQVRSSSAHKVESPDVKNHHKTPAVKTHTHPKTPKPEQCKQKSVSPAEKRSTQKNQRTQIQAVPVVRPSPPPDPPPDRPVIRAVTRRPAPQLEGLLPPLPEEEPDLGSSCDTPPQDEIPVDGLTGDQRYMDKMAVDGGPHQEWMEEGNLDSPPPSSNLCPAPTVQNVQAPPAAPSSLSRPSVGTTDPEEASRMLAEKRRQARQQREEKRREEFERQAREELARRQAEENARLQAEVHQRLEEEREMEEEEQKQMEEKKKREEEQQRQTEEENTRRLQRQREEEEARQRETELKRQRDQHFQREEEARQERKRRLEEIMKRTRKADSAERKPAPASTSVTEPQPKENTEPMGNHREDVILLSGPSQPNKLDLDPREEVVPSVAFKERRSLRTLTGLDHIQSQQRAEVI